MTKRFSIAALCSLVIACSSSPAPAPGGSTSNQPTTPGGTVLTPTPSPAASSTTTSPGTVNATGDGGTGSCAATADSDACYECCDAQSTAGSEKYGQLLAAADACACQQCSAQCATSACAATPTDAPAGSACETCLNNVTTCWDNLETACDADPNCKIVQACYNASACDDKQ